MKPYSVNRQLMTLDEEEKKILDSVEKDEWTSIYENPAEFETRKAELMKAARAALNTCKETEKIEITIHLSQNIFQKIIVSADKAGIDYQNWISNTLQKAVG